MAVLGFLRLATSRRVFVSPMTVDEASKSIESWFHSPSSRLLAPGPRHLQTDIQLAAYAIEYQAVVHSNDVDVARFPGLRWANPLRDR